MSGRCQDLAIYTKLLGKDSLICRAPPAIISVLLLLSSEASATSLDFDYGTNQGFVIGLMRVSRMKQRGD